MKVAHLGDEEISMKQQGVQQENHVSHHLLTLVNLNLIIDKVKKHIYKLEIELKHLSPS